MNVKKVKEVLKKIVEDQENDWKNFEGGLFNGRTVAEYFSNQGAAIMTLAKIIEAMIDELPVKEEIKDA